MQSIPQLTWDYIRFIIAIPLLTGLCLLADWIYWQAKGGKP